MGKIWRALAAIKLFFVLAALLVAAMIVATLAPSAGGIYHTWWFAGLLAGLAVNIAACAWTRMSFRSFALRPGPIVAHLGMLLILGGGVVSAVWGRRGELTLREGDSNCCTQKTTREWHLPFHVRLDNFRIEREGVDHHRLIVHHTGQGWTESVDIVPGGTAALAAHGVTIRALRYVPDLTVDHGSGQVISRSDEPRNPALQIEVTASPVRRRWVFAKYPGFGHEGADPLEITYEHQPAAVKQFASAVTIMDGERVLTQGRLAVNSPLTFQGITLYQSGYDPDDPSVSILQVSKDPGVPVVYAGFTGLLIGLGLVYLRPQAIRTSTPGVAAPSAGRPS